MSQISLSITLYTGIVTSQPAGGWGSWSPPVADANPLPSGATIYTVTGSEISTLRDYNLISDETYIFYRLRAANPNKNTIVTSAGNILGLTGARVLRSLARLQQNGMIRRFSIGDINVSWIKISPSFTSEQIRSDWQNRISDDNTYTWQVLNYQRENSTTSQIDLVSLFPSWSITSLMLGESLAHYAGSAVNAFSVNCGVISVEFFTPVLNAGISDNEIIALSSLGLIGDNFYHYVNMRSRLALNTKSQIINLVNYCAETSSDTESYLKALLRIRQSTLISSLDLGATVIEWKVKPNTTKQYLNEIQRTQLKEPGYFVHAIAADSSSTQQQINVVEVLGSMKLSKNTQVNGTTGLSYLTKAMPETWVCIDAPAITIIWE